VPCAFISGIVGQFFRQFALTIAASTLISTFNSLTLSPALAALLLKPKAVDAKGRVRVAAPLPWLAVALIGGWLGFTYLPSRLTVANGYAPWLPQTIGAAVGFVGGAISAWPLNRALSLLFSLFNAGFRVLTRGYVASVGLLLKVSILVVIGYVGLLYLTYDRFTKTPKGFIPAQDMGYLLCNVQMPDSTSLERTEQTMREIEQLAHTLGGVKFTQAVTGQSLLLSAFGPNFGSMFIILDDFDHRRSPDLYGPVIAKKLGDILGKEIPDATITVLGPPPVRGIGRAGGFKLMVEDRGAGSDTATASPPSKADDTLPQDRRASGLDNLQAQAEGLVEEAKARPDLTAMTSVFRANVPQYFVEVDRRECLTKQVAVRDLFNTLQVFLGSLYVNDFNLYGQTWQVVVQADQPFRDAPDDVRSLKVRNAAGKMVPVGSLVELKPVNGPLVLTRYNMYPAAPINGSAAPGTSSGDAIAAMETLARTGLGPSMKTEWTELAFLELQSKNTAMIVFGFAVVMVFLVLAAQYESWTMPLAVILVVPMCLLCSIWGVNLAGQDINIFTQVGFVVLVGLACKNAILIVEFAREQRDAGLSDREAALAACRLRLRPIVMTSMAFILGVVPLLVARGAGAEMRKTLGTTVFSGMLGVTLFGLVLTPVFFVVIDKFAHMSFFRYRWAKLGSRVVLDVMTLGIPRMIGMIRSLKPTRRSRPIKIAPTVETSHANGHANVNGHANGHQHVDPATPALSDRD